MHLTDHDRMETILSYRRPQSAARPSLLKTATEETFSLNPADTIRNGDIVEDILTGERVPVSKETFYGILRGVTVGQAKEMPSVFDIRRKRG